MERPERARREVRMKRLVFVAALALAGCLPSPSSDEYLDFTIDAAYEEFEQTVLICRSEAVTLDAWPWHYATVFEGCMAARGWVHKKDPGPVLEFLRVPREDDEL